MSLRLKMVLGIGAILLAVIFVFALIASGLRRSTRRIWPRHEAEVIAASQIGPCPGPWDWASGRWSSPFSPVSASIRGWRGSDRGHRRDQSPAARGDYDTVAPARAWTAADARTGLGSPGQSVAFPGRFNSPPAPAAIRRAGRPRFLNVLVPSRLRCRLVIPLTIVILAAVVSSRGGRLDCRLFSVFWRRLDLFSATMKVEAGDLPSGAGRLLRTGALRRASTPWWNGWPRRAATEDVMPSRWRARLAAGGLWLRVSSTR
jgi:hypothetical protein